MKEKEENGDSKGEEIERKSSKNRDTELGEGRRKGEVRQR